ncbi:PorP/SprF family type IX secretion system membrane protein [Marivirga lumbricoides]
MISVKKSFVLSAIIFLFSAMKVFAQEPNFSMYQSTPFFTNPGSIGLVQDVRLMLNYRNQSIAAGESFVTSSLSGYYPIYIGNHRLVVAGDFLNDQVSDFVNTNGGLLGVAYSIRLTASSELSFGVQGGYFQRNTAGNFTTDDQFVNGGFDPNAVSGDVLINQSKSYPTLSTGLYYRLTDNQGREKASLGGAIFNATQPNISLTDSKNDNLPISFKATAGYKVYQGLKLSVMPTTRWISQTGNNFFNIGSRFGYELNNTEKAGKKIELGLWYNSNDLGVFSMSYEQANLSIGASYDMALANDLGNTQNGIFELAISLRIKKKGKEYMSEQVVPDNSIPKEDTYQEEEEVILEEAPVVIEEEQKVIATPIIEEEELDIEALNSEFSHRDYLIRFEHDSDSDVISDNQEKVINEVTKVLQENPDLNVLIVGHASSPGSTSINQKISEERAENIANILISNGISSSRITIVGRGESEPIEDNSTEYGASENRRVQLIFRVGN